MNETAEQHKGLELELDLGWDEFMPKRSSHDSWAHEQTVEFFDGLRWPLCETQLADPVPEPQFRVATPAPMPDLRHAHKRIPTLEITPVAFWVLKPGYAKRQRVDPTRTKKRRKLHILPKRKADRYTTYDLFVIRPPTPAHKRARTGTTAKTGKRRRRRVETMAVPWSGKNGKYRPKIQYKFG